MKLNAQQKRILNDSIERLNKNGIVPPVHYIHRKIELSENYSKSYTKYNNDVADLVARNILVITDNTQYVYLNTEFKGI